MNISSHWALEAFGPERLLQAEELAERILVSDSVGSLLNYQVNLTTEENRLLEKAVQALEMAAIEYWPQLIRPSQENAEQRRAAEACCSAAFAIKRALPLPEKTEPRLFHILHLVALAYVGQRWADARRWVAEHPVSIKTPSVEDVTWEQRVLYRLFEGWMCLIRKNGWDDVHRAAQIITGLRREQLAYEERFLYSLPAEQRPLAGWTLVALYHWAAATELLSTYLLQGVPGGIETQLDSHFEKACDAARSARDAELEIILRWLHAASRQMVDGSLWRVAQRVNSRVSQYVQFAARHANMFEMLPPQRAAILEEGLLDMAKTSIVINLPTSGGKTALAIFRILQALNQFAQDRGWVAYTAPTRALAAQIMRRLRQELGAVGIRIEQLSGAVEIDAFEEDLLEKNTSFDVLVTTPEKLDLVIRNEKVKRPLVLVVVDEAHNLEDPERGLKLEMLLATVKQDCEKASFLLLTPYIPNGAEIADWLARGTNEAKHISLAIGPWQPNERVVGRFYAEKGPKPREWRLKFRTLQTTPGTIHFGGEFAVGEPGPINAAFSTVSKCLYRQTAAMAKIFANRPKSLTVAVATDINDVWEMARVLAAEMPPLSPVPDAVRLVQRFLQTEISPRFELVEMLERGIAVHHAGLSEETRSLVERLAEDGALRVLCATTTIAQGINFPVSSVFLASTRYRRREMPPKDFWNLAGRAGRIFQESVGVVGIASRHDDLGSHIRIERFVRLQAEALCSTLEGLVEEAIKIGRSLSLEVVIHLPQWRAFWGYLAHIYNRTRSPEAMAARAEQVLRSTLGYRSLEKKSQTKARLLLEFTKEYARRLSKDNRLAPLADATGFAPESVREAIRQLDGKVVSSDWLPTGLFGGNRRALRTLMGIMLNLPETSSQLNEIPSRGGKHSYLADLTAEWVGGQPIETLAYRYFIDPQEENPDLTDGLSKACRAIYGRLSQAATWGLSAMSKLPTAGIDFDGLSEDERRTINLLPAMVYYGVSTEEAVLMRMNGVPRTVAQTLGEMFKQRERRLGRDSVTRAVEFVRGLSPADWQAAVSKDAPMTGHDYRKVWSILTGHDHPTEGEKA
ncbi:MAG: DEAD/DEAH box helicase [Peptococcaceae bacterium]|jgi:replicative superfamily II helicase|nr:DEAD/DEAH box helicase [Peptococcaceae bacterium]MDH7525845.1 DEAD/DEAH box helicase [Peptococcaceae bacterium]